MRNITFVNDEFYHVYNRGVDKRKIFLREKDYHRFIETTKRILQTSSAINRVIPLITNKTIPFRKIGIICYCLMPNHYHFLIKQKDHNGISEFMHKLNTSYTKFFNLNNKRSGRLFEYTFKAKHIDSEELLLHVSRYIHLNPLTSGLVTNLSDYRWSSFGEYISKQKDMFCEREEVLNIYANKAESKYKKFVVLQKDYQKELGKIKHLIFD